MVVFLEEKLAPASTSDVSQRGRRVTSVRLLLAVSLFSLLAVLRLALFMSTDCTEEERSVVLVRDIYEPGYSATPPGLCPMMGEHLTLLVLVTSAPSNRLARIAVRRTWGLFARRPDITIAFILGIPPPALQPALDFENALYRDLIVGNFVDSYTNLTLKSIAMLEWADTFCPRAPYLLKVDDDVFVNLPLLLKFVWRNVKRARHAIWGKVYKELPPHRDKSNKYYVPMMEFPGTVLPRFTAGPAYLMTADCITPLLTAALNESYMRLEDVFLTGVVAQKLRIKRYNTAQFYNRKLNSKEGMRCELLGKFTFHKVPWREQLNFWRLLNNNSIKCVARRKVMQTKTPIPVIIPCCQ